MYNINCDNRFYWPHTKKVILELHYEEKQSFLLTCRRQEHLNYSPREYSGSLFCFPTFITFSYFFKYNSVAALWTVILKLVIHKWSNFGGLGLIKKAHRPFLGLWGVSCTWILEEGPSTVHSIFKKLPGDSDVHTNLPNTHIRTTVLIRGNKMVPALNEVASWPCTCSVSMLID